ncbi:ariadne-2 [Fusarium sp. NRRL 52700]|nr:ariadne-2 [Fusarium sp. NRRL 52700]
MITAALRQSPIIAVDMANSTTTTPLTTTSVSTGVNNGADTDAGATAPELSDLDYFITVLRLPHGRTENQIEDDLVSKANALGISSAPVTDKRITSSVESASTVYNARTFSMLSAGSTSTALTTHSSLFGPSTPDLALSSARQSKDLSFTQYDRYLSVIDPHHNHSKTTRNSQTPDATAQSIFSGKDCPEDWELDQVIKEGGKAGWKRCYKCQNLVPLEEASVWDPNDGCPNHCDGEEEMDRRRTEEQAQLAQYEDEKAAQEAAAAAASAERLEAEERTRSSADFSHLAEMHRQELGRFLEFAKQCREHLRTRFVEQKSSMMKRHAELKESMKEKHARAVSQLEDRQVAAEMDLRNTLEASERSVRIRLKHMEAYCDGLGRNGANSSLRSDSQPHRVVTERDLRELGQQYNIRDGMERSHQAKINVMRDRQAKHMEELIDRQEAEYETLLERNRQELVELHAQAVLEEETLAHTFTARKSKLVRRWELAIEVLRKELEDQDGVKYAPIPTPTWPE